MSARGRGGSGAPFDPDGPGGATGASDRRNPGREQGPRGSLSPGGTPNPGGRYRIQALDRSLEILALVAERPGAGLQDLARRSATSPSQVLKILATFEARGLVAKGEDKTYRLGFGAQALGEAAARLRPVVPLAHPELERLRDATGESSLIVVRDGLDAVVADVCDSPRTLRVVANVGDRRGLHVGPGRVFLALGPKGLLERLLEAELPAYTELTETDPGLLRHDLESVRRTGASLGIGDADEGAFTLAAAVRAPEGEVLAAIGVAGPMNRFDTTLERRYRSLVGAAAEGVEARLRDASAGPTGEGEG